MGLLDNIRTARTEQAEQVEVKTETSQAASNNTSTPPNPLGPPALPRFTSGTAEQEALWEEAVRGSSHLIVNAVAGSGKSSSLGESALRMLERRVVRPGPSGVHYLAFNKPVQAEMTGRYQGLLPTSTYHGFGLKALGHQFKGLEVNDKRMWDVVGGMRTWRKGEWLVKAGVVKLARQVKEVLGPESEWGEEELRQVIDTYQMDLGPGWVEDEVVGWVPDALAKAMEVASYGEVDYADMLWLPAVLDLPVPQAEVLLADEVQDLNALQHWMTVRAGARVLAVGDERQCQPKGTMVTLEGGKQIDIEDIQPGMKVVSYDRRSAAFVGRVNQARTVLDKAIRPYTGEMFTIQMEDGRETRCTYSHKFNTRFTTRDPNLWVTYLMWKPNPNFTNGGCFRVGWCQLFMKGGGTEGHGGNHLALRTRLEEGTHAWIIEVHQSKSAASLHEAKIASRYGIPQLPFKANCASGLYTQNFLNEFWEWAEVHLDMLTGADKLLCAYGRSIAHPFFRINSGKRMGRTTIFETQACNLLDIMSLPVYNGKTQVDWEPIRFIGRKTVQGVPVYSLDIETHHTYVADGIATSNSIYCWRGAMVDSMGRMKRVLEGTGRGVVEMPLTVTRRCPKQVVMLASKIVPQIKAMPGAPEGKVEVVGADEVMGVAGAQPGDMVLCRTNAPMVARAFQMLARGVRARIVGREIEEGILKMLPKGVEDVGRAVGRAREEALAEAERFRGLAKGRGEQRAAGVMDRLACLEAAAVGVKGVGELRKKLEVLFGEDGGEAVRFSTCHRGKGLESDRVWIIEPHLLPHPMGMAKARVEGQEWQGEQEMNLLYVAVTRARRELRFCGKAWEGFGL